MEDALEWECEPVGEAARDLPEEVCDGAILLLKSTAFQAPEF
jgi:hypothetical protein